MYLDDTSQCLNLFHSLSSALVDYTKTTHFNNLGMVFKKEIHKSNQRILNHIYSYKQNPELENHISKIINIASRFNIDKKEIIDLFEFIYRSEEQ